MTSDRVSRDGLAYSSHARVHARVLVVDDFEPFRDIIRSMLRVRLDLLIIAEASDGPEAIQKAKEFCPDLILLDINLPKVNGIVAAREIRKAAPDSKIIFLSQETDADIVAEAKRLGAWGYVAKARIGELLRVIDIVLQGRPFFGSD